MVRKELKSGKGVRNVHVSHVPVILFKLSRSLGVTRACRGPSLIKDDYDYHLSKLVQQHRCLRARFQKNPVEIFILQNVKEITCLAVFVRHRGYFQVFLYWHYDQLRYKELESQLSKQLRHGKWQSSRLPYPPGPKPSLISGNASELPTVLPWLKYVEWAKEYGDIVHVRAYNQHIVILDKLQDANALFEKRSRIYSDRPEVTMVSLMGWDFATPFLRYGDTWHLHRRIFQQAFNKKEIQIIHQPVQILKVRELLRRLLVAPEDFVTHFRTTAGEIVMTTVYDKNMSESNLAKFVTFSERAVNMVSESFSPSATIVNALPIIRHIPTWFPGARFHHFAAECRVYTTGMVEIPFKYVKDKLATGTELSSLTERLLK
ncbi:O-methylsterigmatocystin oxidoreductase [Termitomyces sp. T112]|nr:O-methylsterigmatocystin oxidoreductase [Termitomyces sp. T112]